MGTNTVNRASMGAYLRFRGVVYLALALALAGCMGFEPKDNPERIAWVQERLDTSLEGIRRAYIDMRLIDQDQKNDALRHWQIVKNATDTAINTYSLGQDDLSPESITRQVRALIRDLVDMGVLEAGE